MIIECREYFVKEYEKGKYAGRCPGLFSRGCYCFFIQSFQGGYEGSAEVLDAAEGEGFQGVANDVFFQVQGAVVLAAVDERQVDGEATITASMIQIHLTPLPRHFILAIVGFGKNRAASRGKTGATPYFPAGK